LEFLHSQIGVLPLNRVVRIATRKSPLALWQAEHVAEKLRAAHPGLETQLFPMTTRGDKLLDAPLAKVGGKGLFVKELEQSLLEDRADLAVHSMKDVPVELPESLHIGALLEREDPRDAFVSHRFARLADLPPDAVVGTSSLRRQCQIRLFLPGSRWVNLRGNVNTRLAKLHAEECDAIILAAAGLQRLGLGHDITEILSPDISLPAIGQGVLGVECRRDDTWTNELLGAIHHPETAIVTAAERAMNERLQGGCQVPIAGYAERLEQNLRLKGLVATPDGSTMLRCEQIASASGAHELGIAVAEDLLSQGADRILRELGLR